MTYWAPAENLHFNKINELRSSVLFTKVDSCANARKDNELSQVTKSIDKKLSVYGPSI